MKTRWYFIVIALLLISCKEAPKEEVTEKVDPVFSIKAPAEEHSSLPYLFSNGDKTLMSWVEGKGDSLVNLRYAELKEGSWQEPQEILQGSDWFVNWADFPMIAENHGHLISHILKKSSTGTYSYDVKLNLLGKGETQWATDLPLHTDATPTEHGFVSVLPYKDAFFMAWLDGRNTLEDPSGNRGAMTIRAAEVSAKGEVISETELDGSTCDCCQTTAAITDNGPVVLYRDRSEDEIRDISIVRQVAGEWIAPKTIAPDNWKIKGCPVNGPKVAALGNSLAVGWFTAPENSPKVQLAFSEDGGEHFDVPIQVDSFDAMGRVDVLLLNRETALISWMKTKGKRAEIKVMKVTKSGNRSKALTIAELDGSRATGFPQMEVAGDRIYFAWTEATENTSQVKTAFVLKNHF